MLLLAQDIRICLSEFLFIETFAELPAAFLDFLVDFLLYLCQIVLYQHVGAVSFLGILVVDERIVEGRNMSRSHPGSGLHEDCGVYAHDVLVETRHRIPPVLLDVVLQFDSELAVVVYGRKTVIYLA